MFATLSLLTTFAADCKPKLFGLVPWYYYLKQDPTDCRVTTFDDSGAVLGAHSGFLLIGLAILQDLIAIAGMVAVGYIIYGGILYVTSQGAPDATKKAQQTIINALIGVAVAVVAASVVSYLGNKLGSS